MKESTQISKSIQMKFHYFLKKLEGDFPKPEARFFREMFYGILSCSHVHASKVGRVIQDRLRLKKTLKRLSYHLHKIDLWIQLQQAYLRANSAKLSRSSYFVIDIGDITKQYATRMEGLYKVHDGSKNEISSGYWTVGVIACEANPHKRSQLEIKPLFTELFSYHSSKEEAHMSENGKILNAIEEVDRGLNNSFSGYWVGDRGICRRKIIEPLLAKERQFILCSDGKSHLWYKGHSMSIPEISRSVELVYHHRILRKQKNDYRWREFQMGAVRVNWINEHTGEADLRFLGENHLLWLVVAKESGKGYSWFLVHSHEDDPAVVVKAVAEGYSARFQIEEVYRHIKTQFHLEEIVYRKYEALKNILAILWIAISFIYNQVIELSIDILSCKSLKLLHQKEKFSELFKFIYYKLAEAVRVCFQKISYSKIFRQKRKPRDCILSQLELAL